MNISMNNKVKFLIMVVFSGVVHAFSYVSFVESASLYPAGISGLSRLLNNLLLDYLNINISYSVFYFGFNLLLAIIVFKLVGKWFTVLSLVQVGVVSLLIIFLPPIHFFDDPLLLSIFGGIVTGFGSGLALKYNASTGGLDFLTIYYSNKYNKSLWNYSFMLNCLIIFIAGIIYGWEIACYSIIFQFCNTQVVKKMHKRYTHETITIITKNPDEVTKQILSRTRHGITKLKGTGVYKHEDVYILYTIVNSFQTDEVVNSALIGDPNCFINVQNTVDVHGNYYQKPLE